MQDLYSYNEYFPRGFWNSYYNFNSSIQIYILGSVEFPPVYSVSCFVHLSLAVSSWITSTLKDYVFWHHCCPGLKTVLFYFQRCSLRTVCHPLLLLLSVLSLVSRLSLILSDPIECSLPGSSMGIPCPWGFSRQEHWSPLPSLPLADFPNTGTPANPSLPHCRWILYCLSHHGSPLLPLGESNSLI